MAEPALDLISGRRYRPAFSVTGITYAKLKIVARRRRISIPDLIEVICGIKPASVPCPALEQREAYGLELRRWRREVMTWSQRVLGQHLGVSQKCIAKWEAGQSRPSLSHRLALEALGFTVELP